MEFPKSTAKKENVLYLRKFNAYGKSFDEMTELSSAAFDELKSVLAIENIKLNDSILRLLRLYVGFAIPENAALAVYKNADGLFAELEADSFCVTEPFTVLLELICAIAKNITIGPVGQKCSVKIKLQ